MFGRRNSNPPAQATANSLVNKLVTYGLIGFLIFAMYNNSGNKSLKNTPNPAELNYTPVEFTNYVRVKNLVNGEETYNSIDDMERFRLSLKADELKKLKTNADGSIAVFEIEVNTSKTANIFTHDNN